MVEYFCEIAYTALIDDRKQAMYEANELLTLPTNVRMSAFQKIVHRFIDETKNSVARRIKEQVPICNNSNDEVQRELRVIILVQ